MKDINLNLSPDKAGALWLALDNPITKANLSFRKNNHLVLKSSMQDLRVDEVKDFLSNNKLINKV